MNALGKNPWPVDDNEPPPPAPEPRSHHNWYFVLLFVFVMYVVGFWAGIFMVYGAFALVVLAFVLALIRAVWRFLMDDMSEGI